MVAVKDHSGPWLLVGWGRQLENLWQKLLLQRLLLCSSTSLLLSIGWWDWDVFGHRGCYMNRSESTLSEYLAVQQCSILRVHAIDLVTNIMESEYAARLDTIGSGYDKVGAFHHRIWSHHKSEHQIILLWCTYHLQVENSLQIICSHRRWCPGYQSFVKCLKNWRKRKIQVFFTVWL